MSKVNIMDASAVLAYLQREPGREVVDAALASNASWISVVNYCEVLSKLCEKGMPQEVAEIALARLGLTLRDFDVAQAKIAAWMRVTTMGIGASLGDRACLALARNAVDISDASEVTPVVYTSEASWLTLKWPFKVVHIRPVRTMK